MLSIAIQAEKASLLNSVHVSTMRHSNIKLNEWIRLDFIVFKLYYFEEPLFEMKFSIGITIYLRDKSRSALVKMKHGMLFMPQLTRCHP